MKDLFDLFNEIMSLLKLPETTWSVILFLVLLLLRDAIKKFFNYLFEWIAKSFESEFGSRRFESVYRKYIREYHLYLKIVGIRTEEVRRPKITDAYVPIKLLAKDDTLEHSISVEQIVKENMYNLILGDPGAGKSTILDYLTVEFTEQSVKRKTLFRLFSFSVHFRRRTSHLCPIYVPLRRCLQEHEMLLEDIADPTTEILPTIIRKKMPKNFIGRYCDRGRVLLLLDGLDEVASEEAYQSIIRKVNDFIQIYPKNKVVVTCRKAGWRGGLHPEFQIFSAMPLDARQQDEFVHKWYIAILRYTAHGMPLAESDLQKAAEREADQLFALVKERLRELASNPLMLSLICLVHRQRRDLPRGRTALYRDCLDILLGLWDRIDKELDQKFPTTEEKKLLLRRIAFRMQSSGAREEDRHKLEDLVLEFLPSAGSREVAKDIMRQVEVRSGLMVERSIDKFTFSHLTFQEFLVVEYFYSERAENIDLQQITDWSAWREPVLLMAGMKSNPNTFIADLYKVQPLLAIYSISEVDPLKLDVPSMEQFVSQFIQRVERKEIEINAAIPALVNLIAVKGNPFGQSILAFVYILFQTGNTQEINSVIEALSKIPTREAARIVLLLCEKFGAEKGEGIFISGLIRIGEPALYEALDWQERNKLSDEKLLNILAESGSSLATKLLWSSYHLQPPSGCEYIWAKSWALRLANEESDKIVRTFAPLTTEVEDAKFWPYRISDRSVVAAIISKASGILCARYASFVDFYKDLHIISRFSLRVQVTLLLQSLGEIAIGDIKNPDLVTYNTIDSDTFSDAEKVLCLINSEFLGQSMEEFIKSKEDSDRRYKFISEEMDEKRDRFIRGEIFGLRKRFNLRNWYMMSHFLEKEGTQEKQKKSRAYTYLTRIIGIAIETVATIFVTLGISSFVPPHQSYLSFWQWLPLWGKFAIPLGCLTLALVIGTVFYFSIDGDDFVAELLLPAGIVLFAIIMVPFGVMAYFFLFIALSGEEAIEDFLLFKKISWEWLLWALGGSIVCGIVGFFGVKAWIGTFSPYLFISLITAIVLLGIYFVTRSLIFQSNLMYIWLQGHSRGNEVLDEFSQRG